MIFENTQNIIYFMQKGKKIDRRPSYDKQKNDWNYKFTSIIFRYLRVYIQYLCIRLVRGSISFLPSLGSKGVSAPN